MQYFTNVGPQAIFKPHNKSVVGIGGKILLRKMSLYLPLIFLGIIL
jgi:hypothetical protein